MKRSNWLYWTVGLGLFPVFIRLIIYLFLKDSRIEMINLSDLAYFGFIINIMNLNEIAKCKNDNSNTKTFNSKLMFNYAAIAFFIIAVVILVINEYTLNKYQDVLFEYNILLYSLIMVNVINVSFSYISFVSLREE